MANAGDYLRKAISADEGGNFEEALENYKEGLKLLMPIVKKETDPKKKQTMLARVKEYMSRAEACKKKIKSVESTAPTIDRQTSTTVVPTLSSLDLTQDPTAVSLVLNKNLKGMKARDLSSNIRFITRGVTQSQQAIQLDCKQQSYKEALELYKSALGNFANGKKYADPQMESAVKTKMEQILERAEHIKIHLDPSYKKKLARMSISAKRSSISTSTTTSVTTSESVDDPILAFPSVPSHDPSRSVTTEDNVPQSDNEISSPTEMAQKGIQLIEEGRIFDDSQKYKKAIGFYRSGIEYIEIALPLLEEESKTLSEKERKKNEAYRIKLDTQIIELKERVEDLRRFVKLNRKR